MYKIGPLFPHDRNGKPNIVISSSFEMREEPGGSYSVYPANNNEKNGKLKTSLSITTEPINVPGIDVFMNEWLIPQLSIKQNDNTYFVQPSIYSQYRNKANGYITGGGSRFANLYDAVRVGYIGEGSEDYTLDDDFWQGKPDADNQRDKRIAAALKDESNWKPDEYWGAYQGGTMVKSKYEGESLRTILPNYNGDDAKRVWTPSLLYTYKRSGQKATMPGPVLMVNPGDNVKIKFKNNIEIPGLTTKDLIATSVVSNSSLGSGGSNGHGGSTTTNFHGHGLHVNSVGFGDNVVSRYTTGQKWTTNFDIENYHNMGSYWFHPHYHPSVNQQVYGGLSGNMQVGDPLSRVPHFSDVPRNIATIKQNAFSVDKNTGELQLDNYQNAPWGNMVAASTVNGEFNPTVKSEGGWQSLSLSNQANQALYNISLHHTGPDGNRSVLPVFIYGEDGHQYPKIRRAKGVLGQLVDKERRNQSGADYDDGYNACASDGGPGIPLPIKYPHKKKMENMNFQDFVSMPPGKRVDILFYLPEGETEITSLYTIHTDHEEYNLYSVNNMGLYPNLTSNNRDWFLGNNGCKLTPSASVGGVETGSGSGQGTGSGSGQGSGSGSGQGTGSGSGQGGGGGGKRNELRRPGPGQLATFVVENGKPSLSEQELKQEIKEANRSISVQTINPLLDGDQYEPEKKVPSINLYETNNEGEDKWKPLRRREFNWAARVLVGPEREWDAYTQSMVEKYKNMDPPVNIQSHKTSLTSLGEPWGGYDQPFLINDHVFPSGPLTIAQLGTLEEWTLWNWSVLSGQKYVGHPFHIHINDYQVKNSDTELPNKRNLEDTTILNSTGWHYKDWKQKEGDQYIVRKSEPFRGDFEKVDGATTLPANKLKTWGRNSMDIRMMFQDYVGTYVYHCHILPHEDQGMMQVVTVVENTDSSWLLPVEGLQTETLLNDSPILRVYKAQDYEQRSINLDVIGGDLVQRSSVGDINNDDIQDIALSVHSDDSAPGRVVIIDGAGLRDRDETNVIATIAPYEDGLAPWVFVEDFSGDGKRDLITAGFSKKQSGDIDLNDLRIKMFLPRNRQKMQTAWNQKFEINPFEHISLTESYGTDDSGMDHSDMDHSDSSKSHSLAPVQDLKSEQVSVMMADMNLDNFNDFIVAYVIEDGLRIIALDGAAAALHFETGKKEGGYRPDKEILAQSVLSDVKLGDIDQVVLTSGFNNYYQAPLENLLVNIQAKGKSQQYTIQLNAGHFIATSEPEQGDHGSHGMSKPVDERLINLSPGSYMPMNLTNVLRLPKNHIAPTPTVTGARGNGALLMNGQIAFAQGNDVNGNSSTSKKIYNTAQQTLVSLAGLRKVDDDDLTGIVGTTLNDKFSARDIDERNNLSGMAVLAYTGDFAKPGDLANLSSGVLGQGGAVYEIADEITASGSSGMEDDVVAYFGNSLDKLNTGKIVKKTVRTLAGRKASREEINQWSKEVDEGLSKKHLPLSVLLELSGEDLNRVALSSAASKWFLAQWATSANVNGSFSQGFSANAEEFIQMGSTIKSSGSFASLPEAQQVFNSFLDESLSDMVGTPVAKRGMF